MTQIKPKPTLLALLKAERQIETEIRDQRKALVRVKAEIAEREALAFEEGSKPHTMH